MFYVFIRIVTDDVGNALETLIVPLFPDKT